MSGCCSDFATITMKARLVSFLVALFVGKGFGCDILREKDGTISLLCSQFKLATGLPDLKKENGRVRLVKISESKIDVFEFAAFSRYPNLTNIMFDRISVKDINPTLFQDVNQLESLYIINNLLGEIRYKAFESPASLQVLSFENNRIQALNYLNFAKLDNLTKLFLSHNNISKMEDNSFESQKKLEILDLSYNPLQEFTIKHLPASLKELNLHSCSLKDNVSLPPLPNLTVIRLNHNKFETLKKSFLNSTENLRTVTLNDNNIVSIDKDFFRGLRQLQELDLSSNLIESVEPSLLGDLENLRKLDLSSNNLVTLPYGFLDNSTKLKELRLDGNRMTKLPQYTFHALVNLEILHIGWNKISSINAEDLLKYLKNLKRVSMRNNPWNCDGLIDVYKVFKLHNVIMSYDDDYDAENVFGIKCTSEKNLLSPEEFDAIVRVSDMKDVFEETVSDSTLYYFFMYEFSKTAFAQTLRSARPK